MDVICKEKVGGGGEGDNWDIKYLMRLTASAVGAKPRWWRGVTLIFVGKMKVIVALISVASRPLYLNIGRE